MPIYCYSNNGEVVEQFFHCGEAPEEVKLDGHVFRRDYSAERVNMPAKKGWPITCCASGVHPSQAQELRDYFTKHGVPTEVTEHGDPVYRDMNHQRKALKCRGMKNKSEYCV